MVLLPESVEPTFLILRKGSEGLVKATKGGRGWRGGG
jgi:hypothetical protein